MNFIENSGSYFPFFAMIFIFNTLKFIVNKTMAVVFPRCWLGRKLGMKMHSSSYWIDSKMETVKLFMECYFDLAMIALLNVLAFTEVVDGKMMFFEFWSTNADIVCSTLAIVYSVLVLAFPIVGYKKINSNFERLSDKRVC